jgi:hypothetical protein
VVAHVRQVVMTTIVLEKNLFRRMGKEKIHFCFFRMSKIKKELIGKLCSIIFSFPVALHPLPIPNESGERSDARWVRREQLRW